MAITPYDAVPKQSVINTYVPIPFQEIALAGAAKEEAWAENENSEYVLRDLMAAINSLPQHSQSKKFLESKYLPQIDNIANSIIDKSDPNYAMKIRNLKTQWDRDPVRNVLEASYSNYHDVYAPFRMDAMKSGKYTDVYYDEHDNFQGGSAENPNLFNFSGAKSKVDYVEYAGELMEGIAKSGSYGITGYTKDDVTGLLTLYKGGSEGVTANDIKRIAEDNVGVFLRSPAGEFFQDEWLYNLRKSGFDFSKVDPSLLMQQMTYDAYNVLVGVASKQAGVISKSDISLHNLPGYGDGSGKKDPPKTPGDGTGTIPVAPPKEIKEKIAAWLAKMTPGSMESFAVSDVFRNAPYLAAGAGAAGLVVAGLNWVKNQVADVTLSGYTEGKNKIDNVNQEFLHYWSQYPNASDEELVRVYNSRFTSAFNMSPEQYKKKVGQEKEGFDKRKQEAGDGNWLARQLESGAIGLDEFGHSLDNLYLEREMGFMQDLLKPDGVATIKGLVTSGQLDFSTNYQEFKGNFLGLYESQLTAMHQDMLELVGSKEAKEKMQTMFGTPTEGNLYSDAAVKARMALVGKVIDTETGNTVDFGQKNPFGKGGEKGMPVQYLGYNYGSSIYQAADPKYNIDASMGVQYWSINGKTYAVQGTMTERKDTDGVASIMESYFSPTGAIRGENGEITPNIGEALRYTNRQTGKRETMGYVDENGNPTTIWWDVTSYYDRASGNFVTQSNLYERNENNVENFRKIMQLDGIVTRSAEEAWHNMDQRAVYTASQYIDNKMKSKKK